MERTTARAWRKFGSRYNLIGNKCENCGEVYFPPRVVCRNCGRNSKLVEKRLSGSGTIYSFTKIRSPPDNFSDIAPYTVGIIQLDEGPKVEGHIIENGKQAEIGARVKMMFRKMYVEGAEGMIHYHYKFVIE
ncbi:MAG: Zn-ribbon domain-containing OB-fold protein [Candidatus Micrarchaeia archaeon]